MSALRNRKQNYVNLIKVHQRNRQLTDEEAATFERMFRACRSHDEQRQVCSTLS